MVKTVRDAAQGSHPEHLVPRVHRRKIKIDDARLEKLRKFEFSVIFEKFSSKLGK